MGTDLLAIAQRMTDDAVAGDDTIYDRYFTEDVELHEHITGVPQSGVFHGRDGMRTAMSVQNATWKKTWTFTRFQHSDDTLIVYEQIIWDNYKTGKAPMVPAIGVHKYRGDRICRIDVYITDEDALRDTLVS
jgi:hypothetical protein